MFFNIVELSFLEITLLYKKKILRTINRVLRMTQLRVAAVTMGEHAVLHSSRGLA